MTPKTKMTSSILARSRLLLVGALPALAMAASGAAWAGTVLAQVQPAAPPPGTRLTGTPARLPGSPPPGTTKPEPKAKPMTGRERRGVRNNSAVPPGGASATEGAAVTGGATTPGTGTTTPGVADSAAEREFNSCHKFPANKRIVKLNMKPETELGDLIS